MEKSIKSTKSLHPIAHVLPHNNQKLLMLSHKCIPCNFSDFLFFLSENEDAFSVYCTVKYRSNGLLQLLENSELNVVCIPLYFFIEKRP